jgi:hypothetical protein
VIAKRTPFPLRDTSPCQLTLAPSCSNSKTSMPFSLAIAAITHSPTPISRVIDAGGSSPLPSVRYIPSVQSDHQTSSVRASRGHRQFKFSWLSLSRFLFSTQVATMSTLANPLGGYEEILAAVSNINTSTEESAPKPKSYLPLPGPELLSWIEHAKRDMKRHAEQGLKEQKRRDEKFLFEIQVHCLRLMCGPRFGEKTEVKSLVAIEHLQTKMAFQGLWHGSVSRRSLPSSFYCSWSTLCKQVSARRLPTLTNLRPRHGVP